MLTLFTLVAFSRKMSHCKKKKKKHENLLLNLYITCIIMFQKGLVLTNQNQSHLNQNLKRVPLQALLQHQSCRAE